MLGSNFFDTELACAEQTADLAFQSAAEQRRVSQPGLVCLGLAEAREQPRHESKHGRQGSRVV